MDKLLEKCNLPKWNQEEIGNMNQPIISMEIETVIKKSSNRQKSRTRRLHRWILPKIYRRANTYPAQTLPENCRGRTAPKLILRGHHHPDTKIRHRCHKKKKKERKKENCKPNITDKHRCKNVQQNSSKQNPTTH